MPPPLLLPLPLQKAVAARLWMGKGERGRLLQMLGMLMHRDR